jgi:hypothetical protein
LYEKKIYEGLNYINIVAKRDFSNSINKLMLTKLKIKTYTIKAELIKNSFKNIINGNNYCEMELIIGIGAHVMIRKNINLKVHLCNGALGIVVDIEKTNLDYITAIVVKLDKNNKFYKIKRTNVDIEISNQQFISKYQFPLILSWSITIHKIQGATLKYCLIDIGTWLKLLNKFHLNYIPYCNLLKNKGEDIFEDGQAYVALSRISDSKYLYLSDFDPLKITCSEKVVQEYNRLIKKYQPTLKEIKTCNSSSPINLRKNNYYNSKKIKKTFINNNLFEYYKKKNLNTKMNNEYNVTCENILNDYHLIFNNYLNGCFANVIIQMLLCCNLLFEEVCFLFKTFYKKNINN